MNDKTCLSILITGLLIAIVGHTLYHFTEAPVWFFFAIGGNIFQGVSIIGLVKLMFN